MIVEFRRTGEKRYAVQALRDGLPVVEMNPAPGYDRLIPHDMMHLVVEAQLGLTRGIFGQLAAGGGTFRLVVNNDQSSRKITRARKRLIARGKRSMKEGRDECLQSERATYICLQEWRARSSSGEVRNTSGANELGARKLDEICKHLDELSSHWSALDVGQSLAVSWPDLAVVDSDDTYRQVPPSVLADRS
jgi:hypothetical protein